MDYIERKRASRNEVTVINLPTINEIECVHQNSRINFEIIKNIETFKEIKKIHLKPLDVKGVYNFEDQSVVLKFYNQNLEFSLVSISAEYEYNKIKIPENEFKDITEKATKYNIEPCVEGKTFQFDVNKIKRNIFQNIFIVEILYIYLEDEASSIFSSKFSIEVPTFQKISPFEFESMGFYHPGKEISIIHHYKFCLDDSFNESERELTQELNQSYLLSACKHQNINAYNILEHALSIEDLESREFCKTFEMKDVNIESISTNEYSIPILNNKMPPNVDEFTLCLIPTHLYNEIYNDSKDCTYVNINNCKNNVLFFERKFKALPLLFTYFVKFIPNRLSIRACSKAFESITLNLLNDYFANFENEPALCAKERFQKDDKFENFEWFNEKIATNDEQMTAIKNIVNCTAFPFPYVIFGPPGTGKTSALVECVAQILKLKPESKIVITAQSNSACDEIGVRLMKVISPNMIFRLYSPSLLNPKNGVTNVELRRSSNIRSKQNQYPSYEEFYHFNVVIVTLMSSSRLVQVKINNKHFDYMFIDECAAAMEPECLVPILGLGTGLQEITTNLVFLGDHKQLGPVIESDFAEKIGLGQSLMERIMTKPKYQNKPQYNVNYVTQLLNNYRSHPAILHFSNVMFYDNMLRCKISAEDQHFTSKWNFLSNKKFPIIFHSSKEPSQKEPNGTSSFNNGELKVVDFYVNNLLNSGTNGTNIKQIDIGIVSPYAAQLKKLKNAYNRFPNIEIGTAEYYQGREKNIIIISTVKSKDGIGFLKSEKRLNVVLTRAKCLLIIVGNPETLQKDKNWNSFIHFCNDNKACVGERFKLKKMTDEEEKLVCLLTKTLNVAEEQHEGIIEERK